MLQALIFDFNGVILDDEDHHFESLRRVLAEQGRSITHEAYLRECLGFDDVACFRWGLGDAEGIRRAGGMEALLRRKSTLYEALLRQETRFFPGVCELIREAGARYPLGVASMAVRKEILWALNEAGVEHLFTVIVSSEDVSRTKPAPDVYEHAFRLLFAGAGRERDPSFTPEACLVIEDSVPGIRSARSAGMRVLAVAHTAEPHELGEADWVLPSLEGMRLSRLEDLFNA